MHVYYFKIQNTKYKIPKFDNGFTLIELSITIVVIGLIVASVVGGQSLVRQAKLRSIITDFENYKTAANTFKLEYDGLPGDLRRASSYGIGSNGNGNGFIHHRGDELQYAWQHLKNSGLVPGAWTAGQSYYPGNSPSTAYGDEIYPLFTSVPRGHDSSNNGNCIDTWLDPLFGVYSATNYIIFGKADREQWHIGQSYVCPQGGFLLVKEAVGLENKIDDGLPGTGMLLIANHALLNTDGDRCVDKSVQDSGTVNFDYDETGETCRLIFKLGL